MDVSASMEIENELVRRNEFFEQIFETAGVIIVATDVNGKILRFNGFGEQLTGFLEKEIAGKFVFDTLIPQKEHTRSTGIIEELKEKGFMTGENYVQSKDNRKILVKLNASVLRSVTNGEHSFLVVGHDVSELRTVA